jgi:hypothetical protein
LKHALPVGIFFSVSAIATSVALTSGHNAAEQLYGGSTTRQSSNTSVAAAADARPTDTQASSAAVSAQLKAAVRNLAACCHLKSFRSHAEGNELNLTATARPRSLDFLRLLSLLRSMPSGGRRVTFKVRDASRTARLLVIASLSPKLRAWVLPALLAANGR